MTPEQKRRIEQRDQAGRRRAELLQQIARGEKNLHASDDNRTRASLDRQLSGMRDELHRLDSILTQDVRETFGEFKQRMGCEHIQLGREDGFFNSGCHAAPGSFLFQNGALSDGLTNHYEPPPEQSVLLRLRKHFIETQLKREVAAFNQFKSSCQQQAGYHLNNPMSCPSPPQNAADQLRAGKARIEKLRTELAPIDREIAALPGEVARRAVLEQKREQQQAARDDLTEIISVNI